MSLLFETIRLQDGVLQNLKYHQLRLNQSRKELFHLSDEISLSEIIRIPEHCRQGLFKCKVTYGAHIDQVTFNLYKPRSINSLLIIEENSILYDYKYTHRQNLDSLMDKRCNCDDILIVKNGFITDTSFSNIVFYDGTNWVTPSTPLLKGTMRSYLLKTNRIFEKQIKISELQYFQKARLINAMLPFGTSNDITVTNILF